MGQVEEHGFQDSELGDPCGEQPDLDMQEQENTLEESTEGSSEFSELKQMLVQQRHCTGQLGAGTLMGPLVWYNPKCGLPPVQVSCLRFYKNLSPDRKEGITPNTG